MNIVGSKALRARARDTDQVSDSGASFKLSTKNISAILLWAWAFNSEGEISQKERDKVFAPNYDLGFYQRLFVGPLLNLKADDVDKKVYSLLYADWCWF